MGMTRLFALLVLAAMFIPFFREALTGPVVFLIGAIILTGVVALGVFLIRRTERKSRVSTATDYSTLTLRSSLAQEAKPATAPLARELRRFPVKPAAVTHEPEPPLTTGELLEQLRTIDWFQFEKLVALVYRKLGYEVTRRGGANPDGGIDLVIEKDGQRSAIQCKQWKTWNVGVIFRRQKSPAASILHLCGFLLRSSVARW